ncbi:serine/threonine-protein kinase Nek5-like isoform X2 [Mya arenaria]|uniref:serine/threonine-protein kinase Nek5-like isoform X2 n=1 Tax=Mya arenaria TaxID=6604 RepID=UPI0022E6AFC7|nr:serine/threonine-protein kinase Nek5-like isoform X2 [Mya arenaria]
MARAGSRVMTRDSLGSLGPERLEKFDGYDTVQKIAKGTFGIVYKARKDDGRKLCIVMELCDRNLREHVRSQKGLLEMEGVSKLRQICQGIKYLHDKHLVHRDVKSTNIFIKDGVIKVGDFGLVRDMSQVASRLTTYVGTVNFMSPEMFSNQLYDKSTDIWSLGCCVYEMAVNPKKMNIDLQQQEFWRKWPWSEKLARLVRSMLNKNASERPTVDAVISGLAEKHSSPRPNQRPRHEDMSRTYPPGPQYASTRGKIVAERRIHREREAVTSTSDYHSEEDEEEDEGEEEEEVTDCEGDEVIMDVRVKMTLKQKDSYEDAKRIASRINARLGPKSGDKMKQLEQFVHNANSKEEYTAKVRKLMGKQYGQNDTALDVLWRLMEDVKQISKHVALIPMDDTHLLHEPS